jgi:hypothetical protein
VGECEEVDSRGGGRRGTVLVSFTVTMEDTKTVPTLKGKSFRHTVVECFYLRWSKRKKELHSYSNR